MKQIKITDAKTGELVQFYNENCVRIQDGIPVKKFTDRETAERRVAKLVEALASYFVGKDPEDEPVPDEGMIFVAEEGDEAVTTFTPVTTSRVAHMEMTEEEEKDLHDAADKSGPFGAMSTAITKLGEKQAAQDASGERATRSDAGRASNSAGVAASWTDADVRTTRLTRDGVQVAVDGATVGTYKSTHEAFRECRLPQSKHIRFRLKLKEAHRTAGQSATFDHNGKAYVFSIVEVSAE